MKQSMLLFLLLFIFYQTRSQNIKVLSINKPSGFILLEYTNLTEQRNVIFLSSAYSSFELWENDHIILNLNYSGDEYDAYNYTHDFSQKLLKRYQDRYNIDYRQAFGFLRATKERTFIDPKQTKLLKIRAFGTPKKPFRQMNGKNYYVQGSLSFIKNFYPPQQFLDSLENKNIKIVDKIVIPKTEIDIHTFYYRTLSERPKLPAGFKYDNTGKIIKCDSAR